MPSYVVVGASRGLGYQWIRNLASNSSESNTVIGLVRTPSTVQKKLDADGISNVTLFQADMADHISLTAAATKVSQLTSGKLDYLIVNGAYNNAESAGITPTGFIGKEDFLKRDMIASVETNVLGTIYSINAFIELIRRGATKKVIVISTGMADPDLVVGSDVATAVPYTSTKAALNMVVAKFAVELKGEGVIFLAMSPGVVDTREDVDPNAEISPTELALFQKFKATYPNWNGALTPAESVSAMKKVIDDLTLDKTGQFLSHWGNKQWL